MCNKILPLGWKEKKLGEFFKVASGEFLSNKDMKENSYPVYGGNGITGWHSLYNTNEKRIVIGRVGAYCGCVYVTEDKAWITDNALYIKEKKYDFNDKFMFYKLRYLNLNKYADKNAQPLISGSKLYEIVATMPEDKKEQEKIAQILSKVDENIEKTTEAIAKYKQIKKGLMVDLLTGKIRIKNGKWVEETDFKYVEGIGNIPKEWELKSIGDTLKIKHGKNQKEVEDKNGLYPILGSGGNIGFSNKYLYSKESVLIGRKGTINKPQFINTPFWTIDTLFYSEIKKQYVAKFIYYKFINIKWTKYNEASGVPSLSASTIEKIKYSMPSEKAEQQMISNVLEKQDQLIEKEEQYLKKLQKLKSGLMDDLLTGRKRVNID